MKTFGPGPVTYAGTAEEFRAEALALFTQADAEPDAEGATVLRALAESDLRIAERIEKLSDLSF